MPELILGKLGYAWSDRIAHLSYGMVEPPEYKMKSREGTVVDADGLIDGMVATAREMSQEPGKLDGLSGEEIGAICRMVGQGVPYVVFYGEKTAVCFLPERECAVFV